MAASSAGVRAVRETLLSSPDPAGSISAALTEALAGRRADAVVLSCAGGDRAADRERGREILRAIVGPGIPVDVTHDAQAALYAGNPAGRGVVLIAGTGSVAYGRNASGEEERSGGWGHLIGDEGSAFWIGKEGLQAASHDYDGRGGPTAISRHLYRDLGVDDLQGVLPLLYGRPHPAPAIAAATRAVAQANSEGDAIAADIVERGARELARAATVVAMKLGLADGPVYLAGGAFENVPALEQRVRQELLSALPRAAVGPVAEEPAMGAARLAATLAWGAR